MADGKREIKKTEIDVHSVFFFFSNISLTNTEENPEQIQPAFICVGTRWEACCCVLPKLNWTAEITVEDAGHSKPI